MKHNWPFFIQNIDNIFVSQNMCV